MEARRAFSGMLKGMRCAVGEITLHGVGAELCKACWQAEETEDAVEMTLLIRNEGRDAAALDEVSFIYEAQEGRTAQVHGAENYFVCTGFEQTGAALLLMARFRSKIEYIEPAEAGRYAVYLEAKHLRALRPTLALEMSARTVAVPGGGEVRYGIALCAVDSLDEARSLLRRNGMLADVIRPGVNAAVAPRSDFFHASPDAASVQVAANSTMCARFGQGRLTSLKQTGGTMEFIDGKQGFGEIELVLQGGGVISTADLPAYELGQGRFMTKCGDVTICREYTLQRECLAWRVSVVNTADKPLRLTDVRMPFGMNTRMDWGISATERVLRHSAVAGDNSFFLFTPCDGQAPYLLCLPEKGSRYEFFDNAPDEERTYRAYPRAEGAEKAAAQGGCSWRQPVSGQTIGAGETFSFGLKMLFVHSDQEARDAMVENGLCDIEVIPGLTLVRDKAARMRVRCRHEVTLKAEYPEKTQIRLISRKGDCAIYELKFSRLGENRLTVDFDGRYGIVEAFVTLPLAELIRLRGRYIARHQIRDEALWYDGLLAERNNVTGKLLTPDDPDLITGWRVYELTCDDPGLSKPAFLASKNAEDPDEREIEALEYYVERFVWGGLQRTDQEEFPYGLYGIPEWNSLRNMRNANSTELAHLWRAYDYPHIALMYYKLYCIGLAAPEMLRRQTRETYLDRAYRTVLAMFTYPLESGHQFVGDNGIYGTGFYNELCIPEIAGALVHEGRQEAAARLRYHWQKKADAFIGRCDDLFASEYSFDTTGFETTQAVVNWARQNMAHVQLERGMNRQVYTADAVESFALRQTRCNVACRGSLENAYYLRGSDIRGESSRYLLSYMSQMGGWSLMEEALYGSGNPFELLRLASASMLSSWALCNAGDEESNWGYWFPGEDFNGAAGGGFEPAPEGVTWLGQPHHRGSWYYSCEIDLGFCGGLRGANTVLADDPDFGRYCYGGETAEDEDGNLRVLLQDGVQRRFHRVTDGERLHILAENARMQAVTLRSDGRIVCEMETVRAHAKLTLMQQDGCGNMLKQETILLEEGTKMVYL